MRYTVQTRKCHANANTNADTNRIRTKNILSPSPSVGDRMTDLSVFKELGSQWQRDT